MAPICDVIQLGTIPYREAWELQTRLADEIAAGHRPATLLLLEHPHTYTFGRRGRTENLLWDQAELDRRGIEVHWVDRGGDVTYHGPGQLVGYPLLPLAPLGLPAGQKPQAARQVGTGAASAASALEEMSTSTAPYADYIGYLRRLEDCLILALMHLGLAAGQIEGRTGVWVQPDALSRCRSCAPELRRLPAKIAAIGVKVDARGITRHGFALNVDPDMSYWDGIVACGLADVPAVSLVELLDPPPPITRVADAIITAFAEVFGYQMNQGEI